MPWLVRPSRSAPVGVACSPERRATWSGEEVESVGVAVDGFHISEEALESPEATQWVECACVSERLFEGNIAPRCGGKATGSMVEPLLEVFIIIIVVVV